MHLALCLCAQIPKLELTTRLELIIHQRELSKTTASGPLALRALYNSALHIHGARTAPLDLSFLHAQGRRVLLLFPHEDAAPLTPELVARDARPISLVVPDGSWRQASRAARRIPGLERAERVSLLAGLRGSADSWNSHSTQLRQFEAQSGPAAHATVAELYFLAVSWRSERNAAAFSGEKAR